MSAASAGLAAIASAFWYRQGIGRNECLQLFDPVQIFFIFFFELDHLLIQTLDQIVQSRHLTLGFNLFRLDQRFMTRTATCIS